MMQKNSETYGFTMVAIGLLIGFFLGGGIVYWYSNRAEVHPMQITSRSDSRATTPTQTPTSTQIDLPINPTYKSNPAIHLSDAEAEDIKLIKDQLIGIKEFYLSDIYIDQTPSLGSQILDSLIGKNPAKEKDKKIFYVEFRESPLNYTAYRMTKNRMVIYGINQIDFVSLHSIENKLYLQYFEEYFPLELTTDFTPLLPVSDNRLIN